MKPLISLINISKVKLRKIIRKLDVRYLWRRNNKTTSCGIIEIATTFFSVVLALLLLSLLVVPLPELPVLHLQQEQALEADMGQVVTLAPLQTYLEPLKKRDLFKPSIPIPLQKNIGTTTAEQLANRLEFLGTRSNGQEQFAIVMVPGQGPDSFRTGERVAEFVLKDINRHGIVLQLENETVTLRR